MHSSLMVAVLLSLHDMVTNWSYKNNNSVIVYTIDQPKYESKGPIFDLMLRAIEGLNISDTTLYKLI